MVSSNSIQRGDPQLKEVLLGFLDSASSLCDMMNTTMAAILNEIMSIQANEACGAEGATRCESCVNSCCDYREHKLKTAVGTLSLMVPKLYSGSYFPTDLFKHCIAHRVRAGRDVCHRHLHAQGREGGQKAQGGLPVQGPALTPVCGGRG